MQKHGDYTQFFYIHEKQLQIYCCALALGMENFSPKDMLVFSTLKNNKQILHRSLTFLSNPEIKTLASYLLKIIENLFYSKLSIGFIFNFLDFCLLENYLLKFRYFYLTYRCQEIRDDNRHINLMNDNLSDINFAALMTLNFFSELN